MRGVGRRWRLATAAAVAVAALGLGGCTTARNELGVPVSSCLQALPVAASAVHHRGTFGGVLLFGRKALRPSHQLSQLVATRGGSSVRSVCVVIFHGSFTAGDVEDVAGRSTGAQPWAVVVVSTPAHHLLGTLLLARPPFAFRNVI